MDLVLVSWCCRHDRENITLLSTCDPESSHGEDSLIIEFEVENAVWEKELLIWVFGICSHRPSHSTQALMAIFVTPEPVHAALQIPSMSDPDASALIIPKQTVVRFDLIFVMKLLTHRL